MILYSILYFVNKLAFNFFMFFFFLKMHGTNFHVYYFEYIVISNVNKFLQTYNVTNQRENSEKIRSMCSFEQ